MQPETLGVTHTSGFPVSVTTCVFNAVVHPLNSQLSFQTVAKSGLPCSVEFSPIAHGATGSFLKILMPEPLPGYVWSGAGDKTYCTGECFVLLCFGFIFWDMVSHCVFLAGLVLIAFLLSQPPEGWDCRHVPPPGVFCFVFKPLYMSGEQWKLRITSLQDGNTVMSLPFLVMGVTCVLTQKCGSVKSRVSLQASQTRGKHYARILLYPPWTDRYAQGSSFPAFVSPDTLSCHSTTQMPAGILRGYTGCMDSVRENWYVEYLSIQKFCRSSFLFIFILNVLQDV